MRNNETNLERVRDLIAEAERLLFITGAGISTSSGLPTYRGIGGLYDGAHTEDGMPIEEALSGPMMANRPEITWKYLWEIAEVCHGAKPNRGHEVLAEIEQAKPEAWVLTQNVDGLHADAGSERLIEIHGRARNLVCTGECRDRFDGEALLFGGSLKSPEVPTCPRCGEILRPDVVLFGEILPEKEVKTLYGLADQSFDAVVSIGTSSLFPYISGPVFMAAEFGIPTVEINLDPTDVSDTVDHRLEMDCVEALEAIWRN